MNDDKRLIDVAEAARLMGLAPRTLYNMTGKKAQKQLPIRTRRVGRSVRFLLSDVLQYIEGL